MSRHEDRKPNRRKSRRKRGKERDKPAQCTELLKSDGAQDAEYDCRLDDELGPDVTVITSYSGLLKGLTYVCDPDESD